MKSLLPRVKNKWGRICEASLTDRLIFSPNYCEFVLLFEELFSYLKVCSPFWFSGL